MIARQIEANLKPWLDRGKALVLVGPRQVGKTTLVRHMVSQVSEPVLWLTGDDPAVRAQLADISLAQLKALVGEHKVVVVDEAQRLVNAGLTLKLFTDHFPQLQLFITGSSALDWAAKTKESLVGRKIEYLLYPLSFVEMARYHGFWQERNLLEHRLIYGYYPEVVQYEAPQAQQILAGLADGLMYKDLLALDQLRKPGLLVKLLQALALQLGNEVKYHELAQLLGADPATIERYIDLLEQAYVLFRLPSLNRNLRNELKKGRKVYFLDNGIRNAVLQNFAPLSLRNDAGALWENFLVTERRKFNAYRHHPHLAYFWRTTTQQEIDYVEDHNGRLFAFEFKWSPRKKARFPQSFLQAYPGSDTAQIDPETFADFVGYKAQTP